MDAVTPTPIKLEDLTRDELLELIAKVSHFLYPRDLLRARWDVACRKSRAAGAASVAASERAAEAAVAWARVPRNQARAMEQGRKAYLNAKVEADSAHRAADRANAAQERAYRALDACKP